MKKITYSISFIIAGLILAGSWQACKKNPLSPRMPKCGGPMVGNEPTTVMLVFSNANNPADVDTAVWTNRSPNAGAPVIDNSRARLVLSANSSYHVKVLFYNVNFPDTSSSYDITPSIVKESNYYLVCFDEGTGIYGSLANSINWSRQDLDISPSPLSVGLVDSFHTGADSVCGLLQTTLHHQYKVKTGDCDPGYIDIQATDTVFISPKRN